MRYTYIFSRVIVVTFFPVCPFPSFCQSVLFSYLDFFLVTTLLIAHFHSLVFLFLFSLFAHLSYSSFNYLSSHLLDSFTCDVALVSLTAVESLRSCTRSLRGQRTLRGRREGKEGGEKGRGGGRRGEGGEGGREVKEGVGERQGEGEG